MGGWVKYLMDRSSFEFQEVALGDSSEIALRGARDLLPEKVNLYQIDLMATHWKERWDVIFLLDVIEHCPDDVSILKQAYESLRPGGLLFVTTPALMYFWSYNDEHSNHLRRYTKSDFKALAANSGFKLLDARYFMFFLSPLYWLSRKTKPAKMSEEELKKAIETEHRTPSPLLNSILTQTFCAESLIGHRIGFPWGTSILGVFQKPN